VIKHRKVPGGRSAERSAPIPLRPAMEPPAELRPDSPGSFDLDRLACRVYTARRERRRFFDEALFGEPAWDMVLMLYCADVQGETLNSAILTRAAGVPVSTAERWLRVLEQQGLVVQRAESASAQLRTVELTPSARTSVAGYLRHINSVWTKS
jgi:hypothetical protein